MAELTLLFTYICGVIAVIYTISLNQSFTFNKILVYFISIIYCCAIWLLYGSKKISVMWIIFSIIILLNIKVLLQQWQNICNIFLYNIEVINSIDITEIILVFSMVIAIIIYWLTFVNGMGYAIYILSIYVIVIGPIIGNPPDIIQICLFVFFHIGDTIIGNMISNNYHKGKLTREITSIAGISVFITIIFFIISLIFIYRITDNKMEYIFKTPITLEEKFTEVITNLSFNNINQGKVSRGKNNAKDKDRLEITISSKPKETLYLKNFVGVNYLKDEWEKDDDLHYSVQESIDIKKIDNINYLDYEDRQFKLIKNINYENIKGGYIDSNEWLKVNNINSNNSGYYIPYISRYKYSQENEYIFSIYTQKDLLSSLQNTNSDFVKLYKLTEDKYEIYVRDRYLSIEKERFPKLSKLCQENYFYDINEVTDFVKNTMWSMASYTLSPKTIPINQEIPEYFLFESGTGYCVHFATTATLMYRMYGIPARYVTGYMASPSQFEKQPDGTYRTILTDKNSHAWVEIYVKGLGWQTVEVTPATSEGNEEENTIIVEEDNYILETLDKEESKDSAENEINLSEEGILQSEYSINRTNINSLVIMIIALFLLGSVCCIILIRRNKLLKKYNRYTSDILVAKIIEVLQFGGYIKDYTGMEPEFAQIISNIIPNTRIDEVEEIINYALQEAYSNNYVSTEKIKKVLEVYKNSCKLVYENLPMWKKIHFKYIKVYK